MAKVNPLTFIAPIIQEKSENGITHTEEVKKKLTEISLDPKENQFINFCKMGSVHFGRVMLIDHPSRKSPAVKYPPQLLISTNYNGSLKDHIAELEASGKLDGLLGHCIGYKSRKSTLHYFKKHSRYKAHFFASTWGKKAEDILQENKNRKIVDSVMDSHDTERLIDDLDDDKKNPAGIYKAIKEKVTSQEGYEDVKQEGRLPHWSTPAIFVLVLLGLVIYGLSQFMPTSQILKVFGVIALVFVGLVGLAAVYLWFLEKNDLEYQHKQPPSKRTGGFANEEDKGVQNQLSSLAEIKNGWFRLLLLNLVLYTFSFIAHYLYNQGKLGKISSIHFARWVIIDKGRRLLFLSNFDGSWENYLGDFVDKGAEGLTAIWSNTFEFPKASFLLWKGARDEERFKAVARLNQIKTNVWYSAYPELSVADKNKNGLISKLFSDEIPFSNLREWALQIKPLPKIRKKNIQGLLIDSYGRLKEARYLLFRVDDPNSFKEWLAITTFSSAEYRPDKQAINIAFAKSGLEKMGITVNSEDDNGSNFSRPFVEGMNTPARNRILGDMKDNSPDNWQWGGDDGEIDGMILLYADASATMGRLLEKVSKEADASGFNIRKKILKGNYLKDEKEHFGFRDGVSQPAMRGISSRDFFNDVVEPGEFILGYENEYGRMPNSPEPKSGDASWKDWGKDGSYMVFRQLQQNVDVFWKDMIKLAGTDEDNLVPAVELASKLVGRKVNGDPLAAIDPDKPWKRPSDNNKFNYKDDDAEGSRCPIGAHIRRVNPRDSLSVSGKTKHKETAINLVKRHRILRKGRAYGPPVAASMNVNDIVNNMALEDGEERGLHFICFNTNIERQFEFIQHTWSNNPKFHDLYDEVDPLIGNKLDPSAKCPFTVPSAPLRKRYNHLQKYVQVVGGAYFFFPSIKAIKQLSK